MTGTKEISYIEAARREKLEALVARGIEPFAYRYERTHTAREALEAYQGEEGGGNEDVSVSVAGRIVALRPHGKSTFMHLGDHTGKIQVYFKRDDLGDEAYDLLKLMDLSDHIGVRGSLMRTRTEEITVRAEHVELLAKSLRPLPLGKEDADGRRHGLLADAETRYRQRYVDLAVNSDVREVFQLRATVIRLMRRFFDERGFTEVETPVLQPLYGGAMALPFITHHEALNSQLYLRIADELYLKRCIVGGLDRVYEICHDFRNEGVDRLHNPEFTMLEFYQAYADYTDMMSVLEALVSGIVHEVRGSLQINDFGPTLDFSVPWRRVDYAELFQQHAGISVFGSDAELRARLRSHDDAVDVDGMSRAKMLDEVFKVFVEPGLTQPTIVRDHPIEISPFAKSKRGEPRLTERFEFFVNGIELANAFSELNDPDDQRRRFEILAAAREADMAPVNVIDEDYIRALEYGMPPTGGLGLGVDRFVMLLSGRSNIRDVILFPALKSKE